MSFKLVSFLHLSQ